MEDIKQRIKRGMAERARLMKTVIEAVRLLGFCEIHSESDYYRAFMRGVEYIAVNVSQNTGFFHFYAIYPSSKSGSTPTYRNPQNGGGEFVHLACNISVKKNRRPNCQGH